MRKRRRRFSYSSPQIPSEEDRREIEDEALDQLSCVTSQQFLEWCELAWAEQPYPKDAKALLYRFCGDCTDAYENLCRKANLCRRDEWDTVRLNEGSNWIIED